MNRSSLRLTAVVLLTLSLASLSSQVSGELPEDALKAAKQATTFLTDSVSTQGGYLWTYSSDLSRREGEGVIKTSTVWVQPPGTPSIGDSFVRLYVATGDPQFLQAAMRAAEALRQGQMRSGGWQAMVEFDPEARRKWAYRTSKAKAGSDAKDQSSLDDDKTQSALRFLIRLDQACEFKNPIIHEMVSYGIDGLIRLGQFENGGFPQVWTDDPKNRPTPTKQPARYPDDWSQTYPGHQQYWNHYTLNDNLASDVLNTFFLAADVYEDAKYTNAAIKLADSLLLSQMPEPQRAWAQQYSDDMQPIWARKFEPPAISGSESQTVIRSLMNVYVRTGNVQYLDAIDQALTYLKSCELETGQLARFYELRTNRPLYFNREYQLTYDDSDCPTHYGFKVDSDVDELRKQSARLRNRPWKAPSERVERGRQVSEKELTKIVRSLDDRGAWITDGVMKYHRYTGDIIEMNRAMKNLNALAEYLRTH